MGYLLQQLQANPYVFAASQLKEAPSMLHLIGLVADPSLMMNFQPHHLQLLLAIT